MSYWWVPDEAEVWVLAKQEGEVQSNGLLKFSVVGSNKSISQNASACMKTVVTAGDDLQLCAPDDMISLPEVNQASILSCIRTRFREKSIYTAVGTVLMTVNPFEKIGGLYGTEMIRKYITPFSENGPLKPHVYLVPSRAFADMCRSGSHQSILISGESGAGKTEATKGCLSFLTAVAEEFSPASSSQSSGAKIDIAGRIIAASPVLEAFGNAKTVKNPNSSRFGKWMELKFNKRNGLEGSVITSYLLEKSRVTRRDPKERNYHIFYQLLRGMDLRTQPDWALTKDTSAFKYLERPNLGEAPDLNDAENFRETSQAFAEMGFTTAETTNILRLVAGILHLGNVEFVDENGGESSSVNTRSQAVAHAARLLGVQSEALGHTLTHRSMVSGTRKSVIVIQLKPDSATDTRDSLARAIYDKLFKFIISTINKNAGCKAGSDEGGRSIGLLDIFGFEIFPVNSLEQLCINYCNEMLQNHFNFVIFTAEKALYVSEGITCDTIEFKDNIPIIHDIEKLFKALDEEAKVPKGSSKTWYEKQKKAAAGNKSSTVTYPTRKDIFVVQHYAGNVDYYPNEFLEKNMETLNNDLVECMVASRDPTLQYLFSPANVDEDSGESTPGAAAGGGAKKAQRSIAWKFQSQLSSLMTMLRQTQSHFIRCIKSNDECKPLLFDAKNVTRQLLYSGVFEVVKIQQSGLPCRSMHRDFIERFKSLAPFEIRYKLRSPQELIDIFRAPPLNLALEDMQNGATRVFFKGIEQRLLESCLATWLRVNAVRLQAFRRCHYLRRVYAVMIRWVRQLHAHAETYNTAGARSCLEQIKTCMGSYVTATRGRANLNRMYQIRSDLVELTQQRENLINEAQKLVVANTEVALKAIGSIPSRAEKLGIKHLPVMVKCKEIDSAYQTALAFIKQAVSEQTLVNLTMNEIVSGMDCLKQFEKILAAAPSTMARATKWKVEVEDEMASVFEGMLHRYELASIEFDPDTGKMNRSHGADTEQQLRLFVKGLNPKQFKCKDTLHAYNDSVIFLRLVDESLMPNNGDNALTIIANYKQGPHFEVSTAQLDSFKKWGTLVSSMQRLLEALTVDCVTASATGKEPPVDISKLQKHSAPLKLLTAPSQQVQDVLSVTEDVTQMRSLYLAQQWKELEEFTFEVEVHAESGLFDDHPISAQELDNCIWLTSYHNALSDLLFVIKEPACHNLPLHADDWAPLTENSAPCQLAIDSAQSFSTPDKTPVLEELLPVARLMFDLKQQMYAMKFPFVEAIIKQLNATSTCKIISKHSNADNMLTAVINAEIEACRLLMSIVSFEEELNEALKHNQVGVYTCSDADSGSKGEGISRSAKELGMCGSSTQLRAALDKVNAFTAARAKETGKSVQLPDSLTRLCHIGNRILIGRDAVAHEETDHAFNYDNIVATVSKAHAAENGKDDYVEEIFQQEIHDIITECNRRSIVRQLKEALLKKCIVGTKFVDLRADPIALRDAENILQGALTRISKEFVTQEQEDIRQSVAPRNLLHFSRFVGGVLGVRKMFQRGVWADLYTALSTLQSLLNDDGLAVPGVVDEIESIRAQYIHQMEIEEMKNSLTCDEIRLVMDETVSKEDKQTVVDRISDALFHMNSKLTICPEAAKLFELGSLMRIVLLKIIDNQAFSIPEAKANEACDLYRAAGLNVDAITTIYKFIRLRHSLKIICDAMCTTGSGKDSAPPTSETVFETLDNVKAEMTIPTVLVPWLHCAEAYAQLLQALECRDWLTIVNRSRYLEELLVPLSALASYDPDNEARLVELCRSRCQDSYKVALAIKAVETELQVTAAVENVPVNEIMKRTIREVDEQSRDGISALRKQGKSDQFVVDSGKFALNQLWAMNIPASMLRDKGFSVLKMRAAGYSCLELLEGGYTVDALGKAGYESSALRKAGASLKQLQAAGFSEGKILMAGFPISELKEAGFDAGRLAKLGTSCKDLVSAGFTGKELRTAGFAADQLRRAGMDRVSYLRASGYSLVELVDAQFSVGELKSAGYDFDNLREVGIEDDLLVEAGFTEEITREVLLDLFDATQGKFWKIKMNWGTNRPLREWYGVTVELGANEHGHNIETVVGLDLHDNNLCGELPQRMALLTSLRQLNLSMNNLHGLVPACLGQMKELQFIDLTNNPLLREVEKGGRKKTPRSPVNKILNSNGKSNTPRGVGAGAINLLGFIKAQPPPPTNRDEKLQDQLTHIQRDNEAFGRTEQSVLIELFNSTQGVSWKLKRNWCTPSPLSQWFGLTVNRLDRIVKILLPMNNLQGEIPSSIDSLVNLKELDLRYNQLFGAIPATIGNLKHLTHLHLHCNRLTGSIPESITDLNLLEVLDVRSNQLTGILPTSITQLSNLQYFAITSNFIKVPSKQAMRNKIPWCRVVIM
jgi:myosin heavy subunit/ribosomal protein L13E